MWPFTVPMEGGRFFVSSMVSLVQVVKWTFLMDWIKVFFTMLNSSTWYHLFSFGLLLAVRSLIAADCCWLGVLVGLLVRLTCHIPYLDYLLTYSTVSPSLTILR